MHRTAQCACGAATITVAGEPSIYGVCHCVNCKRRTGSAFGMSSYFKKDEVIATAGETKVYAFRSARGHDQERHFCSKCGTTLYWYSSALPELVGIAAGCFGEDLPWEPKLSVTHSKKYGWVHLPETWRMVQD